MQQKVQNKMTLTEFIENLKGLNNGTNFSEVLLESLYTAIKNEPLECAWYVKLIYKI
jgi:Sec7-like guanine-nucleotide exchange factor